MSRLDARPELVSARPGEPVALLVDAESPGPFGAVVSHLGTPVATVEGDLGTGRTRVVLGSFSEGSYAVRVRSGTAVATTAFDVLSDPRSRPRYGFLTDFSPGRRDSGDLAGVADSLRAFHVNVVQLYDWMYRHAALLPPAEDFVDALGRELSLATVRATVAVLRGIGAHALAYAAVYAAGSDYAAAHPDQVLHHRDGRPWQLGDFLWVMDVSADSAWTRHVVAEMRAAVQALGLDGLHLDQYGDPKLALSASADVVDLTEGLASVVEAVRAALPSATLIVNNVNDFPTSRTVRTPVDVTYVEVWPPHDDYADLVRLVDSARDLAPERPVVLAAYLEPFAAAAGEPEVTAARLALATVWAAGGQYLLFGERDGVLVDPYYPRYAHLPDAAVVTLRSYADFAVANGDLLADPSFARATRSLSYGINEDVVVSGVDTTADPRAGAVWLRLTTRGRRLVLQLLDLRDQDDGRWNVAKRPTRTLSGVRLRVRVVSAAPAVFVGQPAHGPELRPWDYEDDGEFVVVRLPDLDTWGLLVVDR